MATEFSVKGEWYTEGYAHVYTAKAVAVSGRVLGVVNIEVPLDVRKDIRERFGDDWVKEVEKSALSQVTRVAEGWDATPAEAAR